MRLAGLPLGILLLFGVAYVTDYSMILLIRGGDMSGTSSYQALVSRTFGYPGYLLVSALQFLYPFAAMISYNIITGDILPKIFQRIPGVTTGTLLADRRFAILSTTVAITLPIALYRNMQRLGKVSLMSLLFTVIVLAIVITRASSLTIPHTDEAWVFAKWSAVQAVGVMSFVFMCHHACFLIYGSLEKGTVRMWSNITHVSMIISLVISVQYSVFGYITFTGFTQGDLFENYCKDDTLVTVGRFFYAMTIILTYPMECFVAREVISNVFFGGTLSTLHHFAVTLLVVSVTTIVSLFADCLGMVLELNGVLSATPLVFIIPTACYLKLSTDHWYHINNALPCLILLLGIVIMPVGFFMAIFYPQECSHGKEMSYCSSNSSHLYQIDAYTLESAGAAVITELLAADYNINNIIKIWSSIAHVNRHSTYMQMRKKCFVHLGRKTSRLFLYLCSAVKTLIAKHWKNPNSPSGTELLARIKDVQSLESLTASFNNTLDDFLSIWSPWDAYCALWGL
ncbi:putative sodium-coupled neutral amino acid transporter 11 [Leptodactylus fuscus]|uniref:putative sodium-coupled neutral amino acid transporter 11 n=1 Tax=Leptodactylus fuscus TaxID=238119 RepID=UPI003F4E84AB